MPTEIPSLTASLSQDEILRYARHLITPEVGMGGQLKLKQAKVLVIGTGGLGSAITIYLAAAGVGKLGLVDSDVVEVSNLQRQVLHRTGDVGRPKLISACQTLQEINPLVQIETYEARFGRRNALEITKPYDIVVDGTDNLPTRYTASDACVLLGRPFVHGSVYRFEGQASVFCTKEGPCYRCVYPDPPPPEIVQRIAVGGILGVQPGIIGTLQALEVIKLIVGKGKLLIGRLLVFDGLNLKFREVRLRKDPACPACGTHPTIDENLIDYEAFCGLPPLGALPSPAVNEISPDELRHLLDVGEPAIVLDVRDGRDFAEGHIPGARSIPINRLAYYLHEFTWADQIVVYDGSGEESQKAVQTLRLANFRKVRTLKGGFIGWTKQVESTLAT
jgi:molybdopterin/thiamine biosynthesis adenylyltransferase/rhodanese-related sulfurtransferase